MRFVQVEKHRFWLIAAVAATLAACGQSESTGEQSGTVGLPGEMVFYRGNAAEPDTLDPHHSGSTWQSNIIGDMLLGLTTEGPDGEAIPGAATSWDVSEDGLTWTFHLREHQWSDGVPVTAEDFVFSFRRILEPAQAAQYAWYLYPILNAQAVNAGELPGTELGVEAPDERTLIVRLENPAPYLAEFMKHTSMLPVPKHVVEELGAAWSRPGNYVTNGAYVLSEWIPNDYVELVKNPLFYDADNVAIDRTFFYPTSDYSAALQRFRAGEIDMQSALPDSQIDWIRQNIPDTIDLQPILTIEYIAVNLEREGLNDVRVREALSLALDRETMVERVRRMGNPPAYSLVPPGIANYASDVELPFADMPHAERIERARELMEEAGYGPDNRLEIGMAVRSASADARRRPAAIQQMWREIYVDAEIEQSDAAVFYNLMQEHDFDVGIAGWVADYNDPSNFLELLRTGNGNNYGQYSNPEYDALLDQAATEQDLEVRAEIMSQAEAIALRDHAWIPVFFGVARTLVHTYVEGWVTTVDENMRTRWLSIDEADRASRFTGR
jgi:oligopeptide transport system substrate-binding protein